MRRIEFNSGWTVARDGSTNARAVTLPHDAMLEEVRDPATPNGYHTGFYPGGVYRYSKRLEVPEDWADRAAVLEFEGVYMRSQVLVNGQVAAERPSGYARFHVPLNGLLRYGAENLIEVIANNSSGPNSRWYSGSGIYRPVTLLLGDALHLREDGVLIRTTGLDGATAHVHAEAVLVNSGEHDRTADLLVTLRGPDGEVVARTEAGRASVPAGGSMARQVQLRVPNAALWSPTMPQLHRVTAEVIDREVIDSVEDEFGIRIVTADAKHGLRINGEMIKLRGACIHHDNGVIGATTLYAAEERRIRILLASGYNAIRSAHNSVSVATLQACDRLGMLVMDELGDEWWRPKSRDGFSRHFLEWWQRDLDSLIRKSYNHPSVILYSIGNEIAEVATDRGRRLGYEMARFARALDPSRLVTNGVNYFLSFIAPMRDDVDQVSSATPKNKKKEQDPEKLIATLNFLMGAMEKVTPLMMKLPRADIRTRDAQAALDVAGYNYAHDRWEKDSAQYPDRVILGTETSPRTTAELWAKIEAMPNVIGEFVWTAWDYIGEAGIGTQQYDQPRKLFQPYPALLAGEPIIDITGHRQAWSYYNEVVWHRTAGPFLAVQPLDRVGQKKTKNNWRATDAIRSWSWDGFDGTEATVEIYADAARVDLALNGRKVASLPVGSSTEYRAQITVPYAPGTLTAVAYDHSGTEIGRDELRSAGAETELRLVLEGDSLTADEADLLHVRVEITDAAGIVKPRADRSVLIEVAGAAALLGFGSAQPITTEQVSSPRHTTYEGRALAVVRATSQPGDVTITATAAGLPPVSVAIRSEPAAVRVLNTARS